MKNKRKDWRIDGKQKRKSFFGAVREQKEGLFQEFFLLAKQNRGGR